jgi:hypothetical protein
MLFITTYKVKPFLNNEDTKRLLQVFAEAGPGLLRERPRMRRFWFASEWSLRPADPHG